MRNNDPDEFDTVRTPDWADPALTWCPRGAKPGRAYRKDGDGWKVQSVLIKRNVGEDKAREQAEEIVQKIESEHGADGDL